MLKFAANFPPDKLNIITKLNEKVNAFTNFFEESKIERSVNQIGRLGNIFFGVKDNINCVGIPSTCSSSILKNYIPKKDAAVIERLKQEGAIIMGKTNMDEFGMGSHSTRSHFGPVFHPDILRDGIRRSAGGSSGGSAAAVAAGFCEVYPSAVGSDTGGSVRLPASYCGVVGFKPSYGRISRSGLISYASSLDTVGFVSRSTSLMKTVFEVAKETGGIDDMTSFKRCDPVKPIENLKDIKVAIVDEVLSSEVSRESLENLHFLTNLLSDLGAKFVKVKLPNLHYSLATYYVLAMVEASSCLSRYPNKFFSCDENSSFGVHVKNRVSLGKWIASHRHYKDFYLKAINFRELIRRDFEAAFGNADILISPTSLGPAPLLDQMVDDPNSQLWSESNWERVLASDFNNEYLYDLVSDLLTVPASLARIPAISLPIHGTSVCGAQLMAANGRDEELLQISDLIMKGYQKAKLLDGLSF